MGANTVEITDTNFESEVVKASTPVLVDFWAAWCAPCRALAPTIDSIADEYKGRVKVGKLDVDRNRDIAHRYGVARLPTLLLFKEGRVVATIRGYAQKSEMVQMLRSAL